MLGLKNGGGVAEYDGLTEQEFKELDACGKAGCGAQEQFWGAQLEVPSL